MKQSFLAKPVVLDLHVSMGLLESNRIKCCLELRQIFTVDLIYLLQLEDDIGTNVPGPDGSCLPFLHRDHPRPLQAFEGSPRGLFQLLLLLLALEECFMLFLISILSAPEEVSEDVRDFLLNHCTINYVRRQAID